MASLVHQRLSDDHRAVHQVLKQLLAALHNKDIAASYSKLDLFWARLAVHIRAEHLHLFPTVLNGLSGSPDAVGLDLSEAKSVVENLRADHDFFMHELPRAVGILRELPTAHSPEGEAKLNSVRDIVLAVEKRLANHNKIEENQIYRWAGTVLTEEEQMDLARRINAEIENRPSRFSAKAWANEL